MVWQLFSFPIKVVSKLSLTGFLTSTLRALVSISLYTYIYIYIYTYIHTYHYKHGMALSGLVQIIVVLVGISLSLYSILGSLLFDVLTKIEPLIFDYYFLVEGYNVLVTLEFFPHVSTMVEKSSQNPSDDGTQEFSNVDTFFNLYNN